MNPLLRRLHSDQLRVSVAPQHGFTIARVELASNAENILWNPPNASFTALSTTDLGPSGADSIAYFDREVLSGGWFPMFPTAGLPGSAAHKWMHGELPRVQWSVVDESDTHIAATVDTPVTGIRVHRVVRVVGDTLTVRTSAHNRSGQTQQITFGEHPCFSRDVFAGGALDIVARTAQVTSLADPPNALLTSDQEFTWPDAITCAGAAIDLSVIPGAPDGRHDHVSLSGLSKVQIRGPRHLVDLAWDVESMPHALMWQHFTPSSSPWRGDVFAIEPMSAPGRTLDDAVAAGSVTALTDDQTLHTWMSMRVRTTD